MYAWIWRNLPGPLPARVLLASAFAVASAVVLWLWVFPWLYIHIPLNSVGFAG